MSPKVHWLRLRRGGEPAVGYAGRGVVSAVADASMSVAVGREGGSSEASVSGSITLHHRVLKNPAFRAGTTRALMLPLTAALSLFVAHVEITAVGPHLYGVLALLLTLMLLIPFADLGVGAAITNAVAARTEREGCERVLAASVRLLMFACVALIACGALLSTFHVWSSLTGVTSAEVPTLDRDLFAVVVLFSLALPLSIGGRIMLGLGRYAPFVLMQGLSPLVTAVIVYSYRHSEEITPFVLAPLIGQLTVAITATAVSFRQLGLRIGPLVRNAFLSHRRARGSVVATAAPMLVVTIGLPIALQSDRLVLSHFSSRSALADYAIVAVLYTSAWSVISSAGLVLWPRFAAIRAHEPSAGVSAYRQAFRVFSILGIAAAIGFVVIGPMLTRLWAGSTGGGRILWGAFAVLLLVQAAHLPGGMYLTSPSGLRFQAYCVVAMCVVNVGLSVVLARALGAAGPVVASAATIMLLQFFSTRWRITRSAP
jgi:O-antigen/teichoic acid export membrane protein